jgi:hypothetical protein
MASWLLTSHFLLQRFLFSIISHYFAIVIQVDMLCYMVNNTLQNNGLLMRARSAVLVAQWAAAAAVYFLYRRKVIPSVLAAASPSEQARYAPYAG